MIVTYILFLNKINTIHVHLFSKDNGIPMFLNGLVFLILIEQHFYNKCQLYLHQF